MTYVLLTPEWTAAYAAGLRRHEHHCARKGRRVTPSGLEQEAYGAVAEFAVAKLLNGVCDLEVGPDHYGGVDVIVPGFDRPVEVKATKYATGRLFVYKDTRDDAVVVLATVNDIQRSVTIRGWIDATVAKDPGHWNADLLYPAFDWRQNQLHPVETLPCLSSSPPSPPSPSPPPATPGASESNPGSP